MAIELERFPIARRPGSAASADPDSHIRNRRIAFSWPGGCLEPAQGFRQGLRRL